MVERVSVVRDLGVLLDRELKFSQHVVFLTNACYRTLGAITRMTRHFKTYSCFFFLFISVAFLVEVRLRERYIE